MSALGVGGAETWLMELLRFWTRNHAVQADILASSGNAGSFDEEARSLGNEVHYIPYGAKSIANFARQFRLLLRGNHYDAIHGHQDYTSGWHFLLGAGVLPPVRVAHVHNPWMHIETNYQISLVRRMTVAAGEKLVDRYATNVCGTSAEVLRHYGYEPGRRRRPSVSVVHCGINVKKFNAPREVDRQSVFHEFGFPVDAKIILCVGRLDRALQIGHPQNHKNTWFAYKVACAALERDPRIRLLMAGGGDSLGELQGIVAESGQPDRLRIVGLRSDVPRLMRAADLLLFPSTQEGLGMAAVEAQAAGLPVLASNAVPREALVVPELYHALSLSEPINRWVETCLSVMSGSRADLRHCRQLLEVSDFSIENSARRLEQIYAAARA